MRKLGVVLTALASATVLAGGCKDKAKSGEPAGSAALAGAQKLADDKGSAAKADPGSGSSTTPPAAAVAPPTGPGGMPTQCTDYKAAIDKLATCDKLDVATRDALKQAYQQLAAGWPSLPPEAKANLVGACKTALDKVNQAAKSTCNW
jgi:hypothetical protein